MFQRVISALARPLRSTWEEIRTAPTKCYVLIARDSGYSGTSWEYLTALNDPSYKGWTDVGNTRLSDSGSRPLFWMSLPGAPAADWPKIWKEHDHGGYDDTIDPFTMKKRPEALIEQARRDGLKEAVRALAVWHDGEQLVGVMRRPLAEVLKAIDDGEW